MNHMNMNMNMNRFGQPIP